jgi:hypothetical protein
MHNIIKDINSKISGYKFFQDRITGLAAIRKEYIKDPIKVANTPDITTLVSEAMGKYAELFKTPINVDNLTADGLADIDDAISEALTNQVRLEKEYIDLINKLVGSPRKLINNVINDVSDMGVNNIIIKANTGLAFYELLSKKLNSAMHVIMTNNKVSAPDARSWLYGIWDELNKATVADSIDEGIYTGAEAYLSSDAKTESELSIPNPDELNSEDSTYGYIVNYSLTPESDVSLLKILDSINHEMSRVKEDLSSATSEYVFEELKDASSRLEEFKTQSSEESLSEPLAIQQPGDGYAYIRKMKYVAATLIDNEYPLFKELTKFSQIQLLLANAIAE